jgi:transketolase
MNYDVLAKAANEARGLAIDAVHACSSGHLGLPLGCAEVGAVLFGKALTFNPAQPRWLNRDRFVLSAGHGSMFLYSWLHLSGFDLPLQELKNFRQLHSKTPGHPEFGETPGVECTTGPLGQGVGNAVGMAMAGKMSAAKFNTAAHSVFDYHVVCLAGDGCMQEGVAMEAVSLAAHVGLDNLILLYDANDVTLDAMADESQSEDTALRFKALGWDVWTLDNGHDMAAIETAFEAAKANDNGRPKLLLLKTEIGRGIPEVAGTAKAHGEGGAQFASAAHEALGLPAETFYVSNEVHVYFDERKRQREAAYASWERLYNEWKSAHPDLAELLEGAVEAKRPSAESLLETIPAFDPTKSVATRGAMGKALNAVAAQMPLVVSGSADLHGSTKNFLDKYSKFTRQEPTGRNIMFGIREHAMGAIVNGFAYDGLWLASGATFATFADYMRPSVRLAALSSIPSVFLWTHDSVGVGEDGPTHQPVEVVSALRLIPNLDIIRPGDAEEAAGAIVAAHIRTDGPTGVVGSRQNLPVLDSIPVQTRRQGVLLGAYVAQKETAELSCILLASGSELPLAMEAAAQLGAGTRVVSVPCMERFARQPAEYRDEVLPPSCRRRVAVEAGVPDLWLRYTGLDGHVVGISRFGLSAPGDTVMQELGITVEAVVEAARSLS